MVCQITFRLKQDFVELCLVRDRSSNLYKYQSSRMMVKLKEHTRLEVFDTLVMQMSRTLVSYIKIVHIFNLISILNYSQSKTYCLIQH